MPTGEEENWRYSRIDQLDLGRFSPRGGSGRPSGLPPLPTAAHALLDRLGERSAFALLIDGHPFEVGLGEMAERAGVHLSTSLPAAESLVGSARTAFSGAGEGDATDELAAAFGAAPLVLSVPPGVELPHPVVIVNVLAATHEDLETGPALFPQTVVALGENAGARVIELFVSGPGALLVLPTTELLVGDGARLSYSAVQQLGRRTWQLGHSWAKAGRDSSLKSLTASLGGEYARTKTDSLLDGQGGSAELLAAYLGDGEQTHDFRTLQEHSAPRTTSDLVFKGAVGGSARSVYTGLIRMRRGARGANAFQTNRNLVLSEGAYAYSVPNLDIDENDVRCSHASAVGPVDRDQLFYLESRGVPPRVAERLILLGYFQELLERAEPAVRDHVAAALRGRLAAIAEEQAA